MANVTRLRNALGRSLRLCTLCNRATDDKWNNLTPSPAKWRMVAKWLQKETTQGDRQTSCASGLRHDKHKKISLLFASSWASSNTNLGSVRHIYLILKCSSFKGIIGVGFSSYCKFYISVHWTRRVLHGRHITTYRAPRHREILMFACHEKDVKQGCGAAIHDCSHCADQTQINAIR